MIINVVSIVLKDQSSNIGSTLPYTIQPDAYQIVSHLIADVDDPAASVLEVAKNLYPGSESTLGSCKPVESHLGYVLSWTNADKTAIRVHKVVEVEINRYFYSYPVKVTAEIGTIMYLPVESIKTDSIGDLALSQARETITQLQSSLREREDALERARWMSPARFIPLEKPSKNAIVPRNNDILNAVRAFDRSRMLHVENKPRPKHLNELELALALRRSLIENKACRLLGIKN
jgi:hypothetical protein